MGALSPPPLTNEPDRPGGSVLPLTLPGAGSFMKNKLIMHTKLHLQETLRCILQASKMIRFTFCSRRHVVPPSRSVVKLQVGQCGCALLVACVVLVPVPVLGPWPGLQAAVHRSCWQPGSQAAGDACLKRKEGRGFCGQGHRHGLQRTTSCHWLHVWGLVGRQRALGLEQKGLR